MLKVIPYSDIQDIKDVFATRNTIFFKENLNPAFITNCLDDEKFYNKNVCVGLYDGKELDSFMYLDIWEELPAYSIGMIMTRKKENREKNAQGFDVNLTMVRNFQLQLMEDKGYYTLYAIVAADPKWQPNHLNKDSRFSEYTTRLVETVKAGELSKYPLFRQHLMGRPVSVDLNIRQHTI